MKRKPLAFHVGIGGQTEPMTPKMFAATVKAISDEWFNNPDASFEKANEEINTLIFDLLTALGYGQGVTVIKELAGEKYL